MSAGVATCCFPVAQLVASPSHPLSSFSDGTLLLWGRSSVGLGAWRVVMPSTGAGGAGGQASALPSVTQVAFGELASRATALCEVRGRALVGTAEGQVALYDVTRDAPGQCVLSNAASLDGCVSCVCMLGGNEAAVVGLEDGRVTLVDDVLRSLRTVAVGSCVRSVAALSPHAALLATTDGLLVQWDARVGHVQPAAAQLDPLAHVSVSADPGLVSSCADSGKVRVHDLRNMARPVASTMLTPGSQAHFVTGLAHPLLTSGRDGVACMSLRLEESVALLSVPQVSSATFASSLLVASTRLGMIHAQML